LTWGGMKIDTGIRKAQEESDRTCIEGTEFASGGCREKNGGERS